MSKHEKKPSGKMKPNTDIFGKVIGEIFDGGSRDGGSRIKENPLMSAIKDAPPPPPKKKK